MPVRESNQIVTERLLMRRWRCTDREAFAALNSDPQVMRLLPRRLGAHMLFRMSAERWARRYGAEAGG